jgi:hypothetical protein
VIASREGRLFASSRSGKIPSGGPGRAMGMLV